MGWPYQQKPPLGWPLDYDSGLVPDAGFWPMNEGSGNKVIDLAGNGYLATIDTPVWVGEGIYVNGSTGSATTATDSRLELSTGTLVAWVKNMTSGAFGYIFCLSGENTDDRAQIYYDAGGLLEMYLKTNASFKGNTIDGPQLCDGKEHMVAMSWDSTGVYYWHNGLLFDSDLGDKTTAWGNTPAVQMGSRLGATGEIVGTFKTGYLFNHALSASEMAKLYQYPFWMFKDPAEMILDAAGQVAVGTILPQITIAYMRTMS